MLKDVCAINMGQSPDSKSYNDTGDGVPFFQGNADFGARYPVTRKWCSEPTKMAAPNDILISVRAPIGAMNYARENCCIGRGLAALTPDKSKALPEFIFWLLKGKNAELNSKGTGSTFKAISRKVLEEIMIPEISLEKQIEFSEILERVYGVIQARKEELQKLDELIKARFVEMFGDARENPNGYTRVPFIDIVEYMGDIGSNGANKVVVDHLDMKDEEDYAMMVRFTNFTKNDFVDDVKYISKEAYDFFKKSQIFGGELIICKIGSAGQNYVMPYLNRPVSLGLNQIMVRIKDNILMPYLYQYLHTDYGEFLISGCINGAVTKTITKTELKKIPVMLPPIELQNQFADFVRAVDKSKVKVQKALDETQKLFDSLMQQYFG